MHTITQYFIIAFDEPQPLGKQPEGAVKHFSFMGYLNANDKTGHELTIAEHLEKIQLRSLTLPGLNVQQMGPFNATILGDPTGELSSANAELFKSLMDDNYICHRSHFYTDRFTPHVSHGPATNNNVKPAKLNSFEITNLSVTRSNFNSDFEFLNSEVIHTRIL